MVLSLRSTHPENQANRLRRQKTRRISGGRLGHRGRTPVHSRPKYCNEKCPVSSPRFCSFVLYFTMGQLQKKPPPLSTARLALPGRHHKQPQGARRCLTYAGSGAWIHLMPPGGGTNPPKSLPNSAKDPRRHFGPSAMPHPKPNPPTVSPPLQDLTGVPRESMLRGGDGTMDGGRRGGPRWQGLQGGGLA